MTEKIRAVSRESRLAVIQSRIILSMLEENGYECELITLKTTGDRILDRTLDKIGGKGLFVKELDKALINKEADIAIHSLKDVPARADERIPLIAYSKRECPLDVLILPKGKNFLDKTKPIGCSSQRRTIQLKKIYKNAEIKPVRGNIITRINKLDQGEYSALVLAMAGIKRLGIEERISRIFTADEIIPSAGQGIIAVQGIRGKEYSFTEIVNDENSELCAKAERKFISLLDGGCSSPLAAYAEIEGNEIFIRGLYADEHSQEPRTANIRGNKYDGENLAENLAEKLLYRN